MTEPTFRSNMTVELIDSMGSDRSIVQAARVSTAGADSRGAEANAGLLKRLYKDGHGSPFEHTSLTLYFEVPIFISRQMVKHRLLSTNEVSGRYSELEGVFYVASEGRKRVQVGKTADYTFEHGPISQAIRSVQRHEQAARFAWDTYEDELADGVAKEVARSVLPTSTYTQLYQTGNLRAWLNFVQLRVDWGKQAAKRSHAQYEIEQVGLQVAHIIETLFPITWQAFVENGYKAV